MDYPFSRIYVNTNAKQSSKPSAYNIEIKATNQLPTKLRPYEQANFDNPQTEHWSQRIKMIPQYTGILCVVCIIRN